MMNKNLIYSAMVYDDTEADVNTNVSFIKSLLCRPVQYYDNFENSD